MTKRISRRDALKVGALGVLGGLAACSPIARATEALLPTYAPFPTSTLAPAATTVPGTTPTAGPSVSTLINDIASRATQYLANLDETQRTKSTYAFNDPELIRWHWTTPGNFPRNGLPLREMGASQRDAAFALLQTSQSAYGLQKSLDIISLQNDLGNDPELYYVTVFGTPGVEPWAGDGKGITFRGASISSMESFQSHRSSLAHGRLSTMQGSKRWNARNGQRVNWLVRWTILNVRLPFFNKMRQGVILHKMTLT